MIAETFKIRDAKILCFYYYIVAITALLFINETEKKVKIRLMPRIEPKSTST
jgi:hypothetical protein